MHRRWILRSLDPRARERLSRARGISGLTASVLAARGVDTPERAEAFLNPSLQNLPDPDGIPGMRAASERLARAVTSGETVWIYTDYDVDGVSSAALLMEFFRQSEVACRVRLPRRDREGYGLHEDALREISAAGGTLVVTADCGVTAVGQARLARDLGIDLLITDHHVPGAELPLATAVVNPKLPGGVYPDPMIAGVGVAWNLIASLRRRLREAGHYGSRRPEPDVRDFLDLVALGTVADVVPLRDVNRVLVAAGLQRLNQAPRPGVQALRDAAGVRGPLRAGHIGFQLGPRLNAAGRMEGPQEALDLLVSLELIQARSLAQTLDALNRRRQAEEREILDQGVARVEAEGWWPERWSLVLESSGWHGGVIGIVASRLVERYHRPTVVLAVEGEEARGSARSVPGLVLVDALEACRDLLTRYGGHAAAAGLQLPAARIGAFRDRFEEEVRTRLREEDLTPLLHLDGEAGFAEMSLEAAEDLRRLEPFGAGNPTPQFLSRDVGVLDVRPIGAEGQHLRFRLEQSGRRLDAVAWRKAEGLAFAGPGKRVDLAHTPDVNEWNGRRRVQLVVEGMRPAEG